MRPAPPLLRLVALAAVLVALAGSARAGELAGTWELQLSGQPAWQHDLLEITGPTEQGLAGFVVLDLGLGPQARAPRPDERAHRVPFQARWDKSGGLHFRVTVGQEPPTDYDFVLYPVEREGTWLVGSVLVQPRMEGRPISTGPWSHGVLGIPRKGP